MVSNEEKEKALWKFHFGFGVKRGCRGVTSVVNSDLDPTSGNADVEKWMVEEFFERWNQEDWVTVICGGWVKETENFIMTSSFLALVTSWMVVPFVETENMKEDQKC